MKYWLVAAAQEVAHFDSQKIQEKLPDSLHVKVQRIPHAMAQTILWLLVWPILYCYHRKLHRLLAQGILHLTRFPILSAACGFLALRVMMRQPRTGSLSPGAPGPSNCWQACDPVQIRMCDPRQMCAQACQVPVNLPRTARLLPLLHSHEVHHRFQENFVHLVLRFLQGPAQAK